MSVSENNRRIARNTLLLYGRKAVTMLIALYSSRVLLQYLGIDDFGLYGLVGSIILVFTSLKSTFAASVQRFLNVNKEESIVINSVNPPRGAQRSRVIIKSFIDVLNGLFLSNLANNANINP